MVSAVARLSPRPPARVETRSRKVSVPGVLKSTMARCLSADGMLPSMRPYTGVCAVWLFFFEAPFD